VLCTDQKGHTYVVEMQVAKEKGFEKRAQYYAAKAYTAQMKVNGKYHALKEVIFLAITNFVMFEDKKAYKSDHVILDKASYEHDLKDFSFTFLELPKIDQTFEQATTMVEKWAYFFKHAEETPEREVEERFKEVHALHRAYEELNRFSWSEEELLAYEHATKQDWDYAASMEQKYDEGIQKGIEKGREEGRKEGRKEGRAEGMEKGREAEKIEIAQKLLTSGIEETAIAQLTGLSLDKVQLLARKNPS
jgi:predicted transposase/invertase (TIGR01784 family)